MATDIATIPKVNGVTPLLRTLLTSSELARHKATIAFELDVMADKMDRFGWKRDRGTPTQNRLIMDWANALQDYPLQEIQSACAQWVLENPSKMPNEGHIVAIINANRDKIRAAQPRAPDAMQVRRSTAEEDAAYAESVRGDVVNEEKKAKADAILAEVFGRMDINARH